MKIRETISDMLSFARQELRFEQTSDSRGVNFTLPIVDFDACEAGDASSLALTQYVYLKILEERSLAESIRNGFTVSSDNIVNLDSHIRESLELPSHFPGSFMVRIEGQTFSRNFEVALIAVMEDGSQEQIFNREGPYLKFNPDDYYLLSAAQYDAFSAIDTHAERSHAANAEKHNLRLIGQLQRAKAQGMKLELAHFNDIDVRFPESVGVSVAQREDGGLDLIPTFGTDSDPLAINNRVHQIEGEEGDASLRIDKTIILLDEKQLKAAQEIISKCKIDQARVRDFLASPSAFLDASLVNLDIGFSLRVHGAIEFRHGYFGETDESGIDWLPPSSDHVFTPAQLNQLIETPEDLDLFEAQLEDARKVGAQQVPFRDCLIDISDKDQVDQTLRKIQDRLDHPDEAPEPGDRDEEGNGPEQAARVVVDIDLNDDEASFALEKGISDVSYSGAIDFSNYKFIPFPYQEQGVRWILGLASETLGLTDAEVGKHGALLADDMGLGKTFMALVAVKEYQALAKALGETERPVLMVAPLSLLENWRDEVKAVYGKGECPFDSIITLQAEADLKKFRVGKGVETKQVMSDEGGIRYALKVGDSFNTERLDMPRRLVLTTYETLRDYQFSLALVDWSFVIFDEAQRIKNPNALWTRAAKALKARFKLLATGTPVENHLGDFWCLMDTARPGELGAYQDFREKYIKPITSSSEQDKARIRLKTGRELRIATGTSMLRRIKEDQLEGLPAKTIFAGERDASNSAEYLEILSCAMPPAQRQRYDMVIGLVQEEQESQKKQGSQKKGNPVLTGLHRLQDVSLHPHLLDGGLLPMPASDKEARQVIAESGKLKQTFALLDQIKTKQEKVIIFAINKRLQSFLKVACERVYGIKVSIINGDTKAVAKKPNTATRKSLITDFEAAPGFGVIVMSPVAAGMGLTVVGANNVIHIQRHWNPAKEAQATDRVYRIGQERDVNVYLPILRHPEVTSFDVNLNRLLKQKSALKDAVVTPEEVTPAEMGGGVFGEVVQPTEPDYVKPESLHQLSWEQFEAFAVELYAAVTDGEAVLTKSGSDSGADGVVWSTNGNILIQAKHTESQRTIREDASGEVYRAKPLYESKTGKSFKRLIAVTNAKGFASQIRGNAKSYGVELVSYSDIKKLLKKYPVDMRSVTARLNKSRLSI